MSRGRAWVAVLGLAGGCLLPAYLASQQARFHLGPDRTGLSLHRGGYRSWALSWSDGRVWVDGQWQHMHEVEGRMVLGLRVVPRFRHVRGISPNPPGPNWISRP